MRIGIYDPYLDDIGGGEKYMMTIAACLSSKHDVSVFWDRKSDLDNVAKRFSLELNKVTLQKNVFVANIGLWERLNATHQYDAIIALSDGSIPLTLSKKLFLHIQQPLSSVEAGIMAKFKSARINQIFYNSVFTQKYNQKYFPGTTDTVLYPPVSIVYKNTRKENIILHVGRFRVMQEKDLDYKKQQIMVDTFKQMVDEGLKDWKLIVATSVKNESDSNFEAMLQSAKGYPIEFQINKTNEALWEVYNKAKIYWHASGYGEDLKEHPELAEHFGISTVEAMGAGAVPVVINAGGQREIIIDKQNGLLWNTQEEWKNKTMDLIKNPKLLEKVSKQARIRANDFDKRRFCEAVYALAEQ